MVNKLALGIGIGTGIILQLLGLLIIGFIYTENSNSKDTKQGNPKALMANLILVSLMTIVWLGLGIAAFNPGTLQWVQSTMSLPVYGICSLSFLVIMVIVISTTIISAKKASTNKDIQILLDSAVAFQMLSLIGPLIVFYMLYDNDTMQQ